jgi:major membrane immunogen (membrane-anchored lipoprotein)
VRVFYGAFLAAALAAALIFFAPRRNDGSGLVDGYYTAEMAESPHGWTEFLTIYVNNGRVVTAEYDARNSSGFIKSWDMDYMRRMSAEDGIYPNQYSRYYTGELIARQGTDGMDAISGATDSYRSFKALARAALEHARSGDDAVAFVKTPEGAL